MRRLALQMRWPKSNPRCTLSDPDLDYFALPSPPTIHFQLPGGETFNYSTRNQEATSAHWPNNGRRWNQTICIGIFTNYIGIIIVELLVVISSHTDCKQQQVMMMVATGKAKQGKVAIRTFPKSPTQFARKTISKYDVYNPLPCVTCLHSQLVATLSVNQKLQVITQMADMVYARKLKTCG